MKKLMIGFLITGFISITACSEKKKKNLLRMKWTRLATLTEPRINS